MLPFLALGLTMMGQVPHIKAELRAECVEDGKAIRVELVGLPGRSVSIPNDLLRGHGYALLVDVWEGGRWKELDLPEAIVDYLDVRCEPPAEGTVRTSMTNLRVYKYLLARPRFTGVYRLRLVPMTNGCFVAREVKATAVYVDLRTDRLKCAKQPEDLGLPKDEERLLPVERPELPIEARECLAEPGAEEEGCLRYKRRLLPFEMTAKQNR